MRDFRDAKAMAQTLRDGLTAKAVTISHSESLELVSKMIGVADWNTLSAMLRTDHGDDAQLRPSGSSAGSTSYPAMPMQRFRSLSRHDLSAFCRTREDDECARALRSSSQREIVLAVQKDSGVDEPGSRRCASGRRARDAA